MGKNKKKGGSAAAAAEPASKKAKTLTNGSSASNLKLCQELWELFGNYTESLEKNEGEDEGDLDELQELRKRIQDSKILDAAPKTTLQLDQAKSCVDLIPVLYSVACHILADAAIGQALNDTKNDVDKVDTDKEEQMKSIHELLKDAIEAFPWNAASWSMAANLGRMVLPGQTQSPLKSPLVVAQWYQHSVDCAQQVKTQTLALLEPLEAEGAANDDHDKAMMKEWIEMLLLNIVTGVEWIAIPMEREEEEEEEGEDEEMMMKTEDGGTAIEMRGTWSGSSIEATSRFMAAMQLSMAGKHDDALVHLKEFCLSHRLHPGIWNVPKALAKSKTKGDDDSSCPVVVYQGKDKGGGVLPADVYKKLCHVFAPDASYWKESSYSMRGYYSYFMDRMDVDKKKKKHSNLISQVIEEYLLPLAEEQLKKRNTDDSNSEGEDSAKNESIVGYEWWVHNRPVGANLGHNLHFDTDEALLKQEAEVTHPIYSSVLYLTGQGDGGATLVLDQTPESEEVASRAWTYAPVDNTVLLFPGNMLHGVLPCNTRNSTEDVKPIEPKIDDLFPAATKTNGDSKSHHRLTFMVGFWTRRVPDKMKEQTLYGPCGVIPPATKENSWVQEIEKGVKAEPAPAVESLAVPSISPVWEEIEGNEESLLDIPKSIDHRFFVDEAPECFLASLFEREFDIEGDDEDDDDEEGEEEEDCCAANTCAAKGCSKSE